MKLLSLFEQINESSKPRGPHEGNELALMLKGKKPLAMIELRWETPEKQELWNHLFDTGRAVHREGKTLSQPNGTERHETDFIALPGEEWRIDRAQEIYDEIESSGWMTIPHHIELGQLLGYDEDDIQHFVDRQRKQTSMNEDDQRLSRAKAMGFDTDKVWYHANTGGIEGDSFDNDRLPENDPDRPFNAHWFSHEPNEFAAYPSTGNTITPVHLNLDKSKEATHDVWRKVARNVHMMYRRGEAPSGKRPADLIREILVDRGYTHAVRGRDPIDAEELKKTGQTTHKTSTGGTITLKWEKVKAPPEPPRYTDEELEIIQAHEEYKRKMDMYHNLVVDTVMSRSDEFTDEQKEHMRAKGQEIADELKRLAPLADAAHDRAYRDAQKAAGEFDSLEMYDDEIGHVTGYSSLEDYEESHPEIEDVAVLDPSIIRSVHADFDPEHAGKNKLMARKGT